MHHEPFGPPADGEDTLLAELAATAHEAATAAARFAAQAWGGRRERVDTKSSATDMVSEVDHGAEALISALLAERRPDDALLGEEGASRPGTTGVRWVVDPLDGTTNYLFGVPAWSVSIAAEVGGRPVVGVVVDPSRTETWAAVEGRGARCNGEEIRVAEGRSERSTALVATGFGYDRALRAWEADVLRHVLPKVRDVRRFGSAALDLCWVAGGRFDAYYEFGLNPWDLSAGLVICREAGGRAELLADRMVLATTPALFGPLTELLDGAGGLEEHP